MKLKFRVIAIAIAGLILGSTVTPTMAQPPGGKAAPVISPQVSADRKITFRLTAPKAESVKVSGGDIPGNNQGTAMKKNDSGVWEATLGPIEPGTYRYNFNVDGLSVIDPRNPSSSESNNNLWSLVNVPGSDFQDTKDVPHGAVASVTYFSKSLNKFRRMHVYTPPGYEKSTENFPVFYLLHGASDSDASWSTVGRAGIIVDNLIATGKAKPMIVVMPAGHTGPFSFIARPAGGKAPVDEFNQDFTKDIMPYIEKTYRVSDKREHRAIAGLSMGGMQTLNVAIPHLDKFAYFGVYSSGVFGIVGAKGAPGNNAWAEMNKDHLDNPELKKGLKLAWFGCGKDDFLIETSRATVKMMKDHKFDVVYRETEGGHTWLVWRNYLNEFVPLLFK